MGCNDISFLENNEELSFMFKKFKCLSLSKSQKLSQTINHEKMTKKKTPKINSPSIVKKIRTEMENDKYLLSKKKQIKKIQPNQQEKDTEKKFFSEKKTEGNKEIKKNNNFSKNFNFSEEGKKKNTNKIDFNKINDCGKNNNFFNESTQNNIYDLEKIKIKFINKNEKNLTEKNNSIVEKNEKVLQNKNNSSQKSLNENSLKIFEEGKLKIKNNKNLNKKKYSKSNDLKLKNLLIDSIPIKDEKKIEPSNFLTNLIHKNDEIIINEEINSKENHINSIICPKKIFINIEKNNSFFFYYI